MQKSDFQEDMRNICGTKSIPWESLRNEILFITGGTGLIGYTLVHAMTFANRERKLGYKKATSIGIETICGVNYRIRYTN